MDQTEIKNFIPFHKSILQDGHRKVAHPQIADAVGLNGIRFRPKDAPPLSFDDALDRMTKATEKFNPEKVKLDDLAKTGSAPEEGE